MIPRILFDDEVVAQEPPGKSVVDWESWYKWRRIALESPFALLIDYPMSVYWLLVHTLNVVPLDSLDTIPKERRKIEVHYLDAEKELNFLPIFSELALLVPNTDITIVFIGAAVRTLVLRARSTNPLSPAALATTFSYRAPASLGGSTFTAKLYSQGEEYPMELEQNGLNIPDAVATNAGIATYPSWRPAVARLASLGVPFGITEYAEQRSPRNTNPEVCG